MLYHCLIFFLSLLFVSSCTSNTLPSKLQVRQLRLALSEEPITLDPRKGGDASSAQVHFMLFEGLTSLCEDGSVVLAQAHAVDISVDKTVYTFHLGKTFWSDGSRVTAFDFENAWLTSLSPSFPSANAHLFYCIKGAQQAKKGEIPLSEVGIKAQDEHTLVVELLHPTPYFLQLISFCVFFPVSQTLDNTVDGWFCKAGKDFVCNGPFHLAKWHHHSEVLLEKNPLYRMAEEIKLDVIKMSIVPSDMTSFQMYENKELDFIGHPFSTIPYDALSVLKEKKQLKTIPAAASTILSFNTESSVFANKKLRKALAYAIERNELVDGLSDSLEKQAQDAIPPLLKGGRSSHFLFDGKIELAKELLAEALVEMGLSKKELSQLTLLYSAVDNHPRVAQVIQQQWHKNLGLQVKLAALEHKTLLDKLTQRDYSCAITLWRAQYFDPVSILERFTTKMNKKNYPGWHSQSYQRLIEDSYQLDKNFRIDVLENAEALLLEDMPITPLYHWNLCYMHRENVKQVYFSPVGGIFFERLCIDEKNN